MPEPVPSRSDRAYGHDKADCPTCTSIRQREVAAMWVENLQVRVSVLEAAIEHVLRHGKLGKRSERRLRSAMGRSITEEILADPEQSAALDRAREQARRGELISEEEAKRLLEDDDDE